MKNRYHYEHFPVSAYRMHKFAIMDKAQDREAIAWAIDEIEAIRITDALNLREELKP